MHGTIPTDCTSTHSSTHPPHLTSPLPLPSWLQLEQRWTRQLPEYLSSPGPKAPKPPAGPPPPFDLVPPPFNPPVVTEPHAVPTNKSV